MKLYMRQKVFSWRDRFTVRDEAEQDRYSVEGEAWTLGKRLHVCDEGGAEVALVRQKVWTWMPRFIVDIGGREACQVVKRWTPIRPRYEIEGLGWTVQGDLWAHTYTVSDGDREVMQLSKVWLSWGDSYALDIVQENDALLCLCVVLAIDAALASEAAAMSAAT